MREKQRCIIWILSSLFCGELAAQACPEKDFFQYLEGEINRKKVPEYFLDGELKIRARQNILINPRAERLSGRSLSVLIPGADDFIHILIREGSRHYLFRMEKSKKWNQSLYRLNEDEVNTLNLKEIDSQLVELRQLIDRTRSELIAQDPEIQKLTQRESALKKAIESNRLISRVKNENEVLTREEEDLLGELLIVGLDRQALILSRIEPVLDRIASEKMPNLILSEDFINRLTQNVARSIPAKVD